MSTMPARPTDLTEALAAALPMSRPGSREALTERAQIRHARAGEVVTRQGEGQLVGLVLEGFVGMIRTTVDGRRLMPRVARPTELCIFMPLGNRSAGADAVALSASRVALWPSETVRHYAAADAGLALDMLDQVVDAVDDIIESLDGLLHQNAVRRVARILYLYQPMFFDRGSVLTRAHLPILVGTSREMTGRVLRRLDALSIVRRVGRVGLHLLDPAGLERLAKSPHSEMTVHDTEQVPRQGTGSSAR